MPRQRLELTDEERRLYNNEMARKQSKARKKRKEKEFCKELISDIMSLFEKLGWDKTDLIVGTDEEMLESVTQAFIKLGKYKIVIGSKIGVKKK